MAYHDWRPGLVSKARLEVLLTSGLDSRALTVQVLLLHNCLDGAVLDPL